MSLILRRQQQQPCPPRRLKMESYNEHKNTLIFDVVTPATFTESSKICNFSVQTTDGVESHQQQIPTSHPPQRVLGTTMILISHRRICNSAEERRLSFIFLHSHSRLKFAIHLLCRLKTIYPDLLNFSSLLNSQFTLAADAVLLSRGILNFFSILISSHFTFHANIIVDAGKN